MYDVMKKMVMTEFAEFTQIIGEVIVIRSSM